MASSSPGSPYLPHINGLRALAILGVLLYHLQPGYCPAGYFGVDLFLLISGFLLLRSLLRPENAQSFHYGRYLLKKAWRILPAWFAVTLAVCALTMYLQAPSRAMDILKTARYSALCLADYHIDRSCDYFNAYSQQNPLLHFWYLSITLQFYIIAPLLLIPVARWCSRQAALALLTLLALLSLAYYILTTTNTVPESLRLTLLHAVGTKTAYYHLIPRFWEFAAGLGVLLLPEFTTHPRLRAALGLLGLIGLGGSFYLFSTGSPAVYLTVISSLAALRYGDSGISGRILSLKPLQTLGTISFSLYLWHWPIMVFWKYCCLESPGLWGEAAMLALSLALGALSWRLIERLDMPKHTGWKGIALRSSVLLLLPIAAVCATRMHKVVKGNVTMLPASAQPTMPPIVEKEPRVLRGLESLPSLQLNNAPRRLGTGNSAPRFLLMGDSHAHHLSNSLHKACLRHGVRGLYLNNSVLPYWNLLRTGTSFDPAVWNQKLANTLLRYLEQQPDIRYVIIAQRWETRLRTPEDADERSGTPIRSEDERQQFTTAGLREWCARLCALGKQPILLEDTPTFALPFPLDEWERYQSLHLLQRLRPYRERILTQEEHAETQATGRKLLRQLEEEGVALRLDASPGLMEQGVFPARSQGEFLYSDDNHLTPLGANRAIRYLMPLLLDIMNHDSHRKTP